MEYLLTVLSTGRFEYMERMIDSFREHVTPQPAAIFCYLDGATAAETQRAAELLRWGYVSGNSSRLGQCRAQKRCWDSARGSALPWAFHMEEDYVILRPTELRDLRDRLIVREHLQQMALVRTPWGAEVEHGGYIRQFPGWYTRRYGNKWMGWIEQQRNWTNAPALYRTELCRTFDWPAEPGCETTIGPMILQERPEAEFGLWGWGEPWCAHIGVERAKGSHGY